MNRKSLETFFANDGLSNIHFWSKIHEKCATFKFLTFDMNGQNGSESGTLLPHPSSTSTKICYLFRFRIPANYIHRE